MPADRTLEESPPKPKMLERALDRIERIGNALPNPAVLFFAMLVLTWVVSSLLAPVAFDEIHPATGEPIRVANQLSGAAMAEFLSDMVKTFTGFHPLGVVLVALLGVGVAEKTGLVNAGLKQLMDLTPKALLTPMLIFVAIVSHSAVDAGYVLVIPLGGIIFYAAGRHPIRVSIIPGGRRGKEKKRKGARAQRRRGANL